MASRKKVVGTAAVSAAALATVLGAPVASASHHDGKGDGLDHAFFKWVEVAETNPFPKLPAIDVLLKSQEAPGATASAILLKSTIKF